MQWSATLYEWSLLSLQWSLFRFQFQDFGGDELKWSRPNKVWPQDRTMVFIFHALNSQRPDQADLDGGGGWPPPQTHFEKRVHKLSSVAQTALGTAVELPRRTRESTAQEKVARTQRDSGPRAVLYISSALLWQRDLFFFFF